jgi:hypothetical protein
MFGNLTFTKCMYQMTEMLTYFDRQASPPCLKLFTKSSSELAPLVKRHSVYLSRAFLVFFVHNYSRRAAWNVNRWLVWFVGSRQTQRFRWSLTSVSSFQGVHIQYTVFICSSTKLSDRQTISYTKFLLIYKNN